jgi:hypothetical protein
MIHSMHGSGKKSPKKTCPRCGMAMKPGKKHKCE